MGAQNVTRDPVRREYSRLAARYDRRWSSFNEATVAATLGRIAVSGRERILDAGCGTGNLILRLRERWPGLACWGADLSGEMLRVAKGKLAGRAPPLIQADAERLPFPGASFDIVTSCNALHYCPRPARALAEFRRVLRPGGRLVLTDWCHDYLSCKLCDAFLTLSNRAHRRAMGTRACAEALQEAGFSLESIDSYKVSWLWGLMTARASKAASS